MKEAIPAQLKLLRELARAHDLQVLHEFVIRGKRGISRLRWMAENGILISLREESAARGIFLLNRLEQLKLQKRELEEKQGILFRDENVENAISLVDAEIESVQGELARREEKKT